MSDLWNVDVALDRILQGITPLPAERISLPDSLDRVLAEGIYAQANLPPFANSSMDGYAVRSSDTTDARRDHPVSLRVNMDIPAGTAADCGVGQGEAARIMTGAPMPPGADAVIPVEYTDASWCPAGHVALPSTVRIYRNAQPGENVRQIGEDIRAGQLVLPVGTLLRAQEIGVLASLGYMYVPVSRQPRVAILSTGDELADLDEPLTPGKIHDSNSYTLAALVKTFHGIPIRLPIARDNLDDVRRRFNEALAQRPDVILSSAGVSVGAFDVVRAVLEEIGKIEFWRINLRPGKPLAYGSIRGVPFFGLPGNPVSAMVTFDVFVRPVLCRMGSRPESTAMIGVLTGEDIHSDGRRSYLRVKLSNEDGQLIARLTGTQSSGVLSSMVLADGLLIVPEGATHVPAGSQLQVRLLRYINQ
ncbi:MAG: molybdopterin molybdotransferase MoeA [Chloroflexi bacterium]|nr:molybdopterin molybdotransferase MoeA [Chloroflexota bacterium]